VTNAGREETALQGFTVQPVVAIRHPLGRTAAQGQRQELDRGPVLANGKEMMLTSVLVADPDLIVRMPEDTLWPFLTTAAITVLMAGLLLRLWWPAAAEGAAILLCEIPLCALAWL
jgi:hypothetical protein